VTWFPLAVLWFGSERDGDHLVVLMGSVCSIAIRRGRGCSDIPPLLLGASSMLGAAVVTLRLIVLPAMLPSMVQGLKLAGRSRGGRCWRRSCCS
jgi:NitT/TauT family transport system permease protein